MNIRISIVSIAALGLMVGACGKGDKDKKKAKPTAKNTNTNTKSEKTPPPSTPSGGCAEKNELTVSFADEGHGVKVGAMPAKSYMGYITGMSQSKTVAKYATVAVANTPEIVLGQFGAMPPKSEGDLVVILSFKTANVPTELKDQVANYNKLSVAAGKYEPGWMKPTQSLQVNAFVGARGSGPSISGDATGSATLTSSTAERLCGTIDLTSKKGSTIKGSFNVAVQKDLWLKK